MKNRGLHSHREKSVKIPHGGGGEEIPIQHLSAYRKTLPKKKIRFTRVYVMYTPETRNKASSGFSLKRMKILPSHVPLSCFKSDRSVLNGSLYITGPLPEKSVTVAEYK